MTTTTLKTIRILLVDEQTIVRMGLRLLLEQQPGFVVVGEVASLADVTSILPEAPDIILLDLESFSHQVNLTPLPDVVKAISGPRILLLTDEDDAEGSLQAVRLGAMGLVHKNEPAEVLWKAIERVAAGEVWINRALMARVIGGFWHPDSAHEIEPNPEASKIASLTEREREVVSLIGEGLRNKQIAERLFISEITVRHHLTSIFDKLGVSDRFELAIYAYRNSLATVPF